MKELQSNWQTDKQPPKIARPLSALPSMPAWLASVWASLSAHWPLLPILGIALFFRIWGSKAGLPYLYNPGESIVVRQALAYGSGTLRPYSFVYPSLYSYLLFSLYGSYFLIGKLLGSFPTVADFAISYFLNPTPFYWIGRLLTGSMGIATVGLVYLVASRAYGRQEGFLAAAFLSVSHLHVVHSHYALTDAPMTFTVMLATWLIFRAVQKSPAWRGSLASWPVAGFAIGMASAMKYPAALMIAMLFVAGILWKKRGQVAVRKTLLVLAVSVASAGAGFILASPYALLDFRGLWADLVGAQLGLNLGIAKPFLETMLFYLQTLVGTGLGRLLGSVSLLGIGYLFWRHSDHDLLMISFPIVYLFFLGFQGRYQPNWLLPVLPFFCIAAAVLIVRLAHRLRGPGRAGYPFMALSALILMFYPTWSSYFYDQSICQKDTRTLAKEWIESHIPAGSRILLDSSSTGPPLYPTVASLQRYFEQVERDKEIAERPEVARQAFTNYQQYQLEAAKRYAEQQITYDLDYMQAAWWRAEESDADLPEFPVFGAYRERIFSLNQLRQAGFDYVIVSSFQYRKYLTPEAKERWPSYYSFYRSLEEECDLVQTFQADPVHQPGPDIKVYALRGKP